MFHDCTVSYHQETAVSCVCNVGLLLVKVFFNLISFAPDVRLLLWSHLLSNCPLFLFCALLFSSSGDAVCVNVSSGCPLDLFPHGVLRMAPLGMDVSDILLACPIHSHLVFFTSSKIGSIRGRLWNSVLVDISFGNKRCTVFFYSGH